MKLLHHLCLISAVSLLLNSGPLNSSARAQQALTNDSVIQMTRAGIGDSIIVQSIDSAPATFSTSTSDLITLKKAGVSDRVIGAMIAKHSNTMNAPDLPGTAAAAEAEGSVPTPAGDASFARVDELGVYYKSRDGKWAFMEPEIVNFRSGGALKSIATDGVVKQDRNGRILGPSALLALTQPATFLLYMSAGAAPIDFVLLRLRPGGGKSREFRVETGGVFHSSSGAARDQIGFNATRVGPHMYQFTLPADAGKGEYGILPPGAMSGQSAGTGGRVFTFRIAE